MSYPEQPQAWPLPAGLTNAERPSAQKTPKEKTPGWSTPKIRLGTRKIKTKLFEKSETTRKSAWKMAPPAHGRADRATEGGGGSPSPGPDLAETEPPVREPTAE